MLSILRYLRHHVELIKRYFVGELRLNTKRLIKQGRLTIGPHTWSSTPNIRTYVYNDNTLTIGDYCSINEEAIFMVGGAHAIDTVTSYPHRILWKMEGAGEDGFPAPTDDIVVGSDVWVGAGAWILSGAEIGHGAVIGTAAVVRSKVPPYGIVAGNPARLVGFRHTEEQRAALLDIAWWDWPEDEVRKAVPLLASTDIDAFIAYARERFPDTTRSADADDVVDGREAAQP